MNNVPKLRFKEFSGEWEHKSIGHIGTFFSGGTPTSSNKSYYNGIIPFIGSGKIGSTEVEQYITQEALENSSAKMVEVGDLLYALYGATSGEVALSRIEGAINQAVLCIRTDENKIFLKTWLEKNKAKILSTYLQGGQGNLSAQIVKSLKLDLPSKPEQEKIASFLTSLDAKIEQLTKKEELLQQYKKGVMQKIFSGEIRFKADDGSEFPDWEEVRFGNIYHFVSTNSYSRACLTYDIGDVKNIHYGDIHTKFRSNFYIDREDVPFINREIDISKIKNESYCIEKDLIIADASEDYNDIGKTIEIINLNNEKIVAGLHTYIARDTNDKMALGYGGYFMQTHDIRLQMMKLATGISVLGISKGNLSKLKLSLPSKEEQTKIANFLSSLDFKIEQVQKQLEVIKIFKKALLQQMFI